MQPFLLRDWSSYPHINISVSSSSLPLYPSAVVSMWPNGSEVFIRTFQIAKGVNKGNGTLVLLIVMARASQSRLIWKNKIVIEMEGSKLEKLAKNILKFSSPWSLIYPSLPGGLFICVIKFHFVLLRIEFLSFETQRVLINRTRHTRNELGNISKVSGHSVWI